MFPDTPTSASSSPADAVMVANPPVRQGMRVRRATTIRLVSSDSLTPRACLVSLFFAAGVILVAIGSSMSFFEWNGQQAISFQGYNVIKDLGTVKGWLGSAVFTGCNYASNAINPNPISGDPSFACAQDYLQDTTWSTMMTLLNCPSATGSSKASLFPSGPGYIFSAAPSSGGSSSGSGGSGSGSGSNSGGGSSLTPEDQAAASACSSLQALHGVSTGTTVLLVLTGVLSMFACCSLSCIWCRVRDPVIVDPESHSHYSFRKRGSVGMLFPSFMTCCGCCASPATTLMMDAAPSDGSASGASGSHDGAGAMPRKSSIGSPSGGNVQTPVASIFAGGATSFDSPKTVFFLILAIIAVLLAACVLFGVGVMTNAWPSWQNFYNYCQAPQLVTPEVSSLNYSAKLQTGYWLCVAALVGCFPLAAFSSWGLFLAMEDLQSAHYKRVMLTAFAAGENNHSGNKRGTSPGRGNASTSSASSLGTVSSGSLSRGAGATGSKRVLLTSPASAAAGAGAGAGAHAHDHSQNHSSSLADLGVMMVDDDDGPDVDDDDHNALGVRGGKSKVLTKGGGELGTSTPILSFTNPAAGMAAALKPKASNAEMGAGAHAGTAALPSVASGVMPSSSAAAAGTNNAASFLLQYKAPAKVAKSS